MRYLINPLTNEKVNATSKLGKQLLEIHKNLKIVNVKNPPKKPIKQMKKPPKKQIKKPIKKLIQKPIQPIKKPIKKVIKPLKKPIKKLIKKPIKKVIKKPKKPSKPLKKVIKNEPKKSKAKPQLKRPRVVLKPVKKLIVKPITKPIKKRIKKIITPTKKLPIKQSKRQKIILKPLLPRQIIQPKQIHIPTNVPQPVPKPVPKAKTKRKTKPKTKPIIEPIPASKPQPEPQPELEPEPIPEPIPEPEPVVPIVPIAPVAPIVPIPEPVVPIAPIVPVAPIVPEPPELKSTEPINLSTETISSSIPELPSTPAIPSTPSAADMIAEMRIGVQQYKQQLNQLKKQLLKANKEKCQPLYTMTEKFEKEKQDLENQIENSGVEIITLQQQLQVQNENVKKLSECDSNLEKLQIEYNTKLEAQTTLTHQIKQLKDSIGDYQNKLSQMDALVVEYEKYKSMNESSMESTNQISVLQQQISNCQQNIVNRLQQFANDKITAQRKYNELLNMNEQIQAKIDEYKSKINENKQPPVSEEIPNVPLTEEIKEQSPVELPSTEPFELPLESPQSPGQINQENKPIEPIEPNQPINEPIEPQPINEPMELKKTEEFKTEESIQSPQLNNQPATNLIQSAQPNTFPAPKTVIPSNWSLQQKKISNQSLQNNQLFANKLMKFKYSDLINLSVNFDRMEFKMYNPNLFIFWECMDKNNYIRHCFINNDTLISRIIPKHINQNTKIDNVSNKMLIAIARDVILLNQFEILFRRKFNNRDLPINNRDQPNANSIYIYEIVTEIQFNEYLLSIQGNQTKISTDQYKVIAQ